jgi:hypothetical protein
MRKLAVTENITLDGVIDASEGWFAPAGEAEIDQSDVTRQFANRRRPPMRCCWEG